jgi:hypothetical protein
MDAKSLRRSQPFLFHAVLTVTADRQPGLQIRLAAEFKEQVSYRIIRHAHKSLELLQGLLIYTAWWVSLLELYDLPAYRCAQVPLLL